MYYNHNLRTRIQEWRNRLYKFDYNHMPNQYIFFIKNLDSEPIIKGILNEAMDKYNVTESVVEGWKVKLNILRDVPTKFSNPEEFAAYIFGLLKWLQKQPNIGKAILNLTYSRNESDAYTRFNDDYITHLTNYLHDVLDESNSMLYLLEKYKRRTEWFMREQLLAKYNSASGKNEKALEADLLLYLFDQGIDYPLSTPASASGRADIVGLIDTEDPLVMEIKIVDKEKKYGKGRVAGGFAQVVKYSNDYHKNVGYLVIFNIDPEEIEIQTAVPSKQWPPRVHLNNKVYYIITVNLNNQQSASKVGKLKKLTIKESELTKV